MTSKNLEQTSHWYKEPSAWLVFLLPLSAVIAGLITVFIAVKNADTPVLDDVQKTGLKIVANTAASDRAQELGVTATATLDYGEELVQVNVHGFSESGSKLIMTLVNPTVADRDIVIELTRINEGLYTGRIMDRPKIVKQVFLTDPVTGWRLEAEFRKNLDNLEFYPGNNNERF